jgi:hypothetical protein
MVGHGFLFLLPDEIIALARRNFKSTPPFPENRT